jgi:acetyltransferase-like isoleucine patch superfamily enzyme
MPTQNLRRNLRNCLTVGFGKTHYRSKKNNKIVYIDAKGRKHIVKRLPGCHIYFYGENNYIEISAPLNALQLKAKLYGNSKIIIKSSKYENRCIDVDGIINKCSLEIESDFYVNGNLKIEFTEESGVRIGQDCMFSYGITIRTGDGHKIRDLKTGEILNKNDDVIIGNHVWVASMVTILKGTKIPDNCIVGARSLVNKKFDEPNVILVGIPAVIKKRGIQWER